MCVLRGRIGLVNGWIDPIGMGFELVAKVFDRPLEIVNAFYTCVKGVDKEEFLCLNKETCGRFH